MNAAEIGQDNTPSVVSNSAFRIQIGARVDTPHGTGTVVAHEEIFKKDRWGVALDVSRLSFSPAYFWPKDLKAA